MQRSANTADGESEQSHPAVDVETTGPETLSLRVDEESVELTKTRPEMVQKGGSEEPVETTTAESIQMDIEEQSINQYTEFTAEHEGFSSSVSSKSDTERIALVEISDDGDITWHDPRAGVDLDSVRHLRDDTVWSHELTALPGVKVEKTGSSDTHRSYTKRKIRVERQAVEAADGRLLVLKWRDADGASKGNSGWSKFQPIAASEIRMEADDE